MTAPRRWHLAAATALLAMALGGLAWTAAGSLAEGRLEELALLTLGLQLFIGLLCLAAALAGRAPPIERLGLGPGRLSGLQVGALALGMLALSHGVDALLEWARLRDGTLMQELDGALAGIRGRTLAIALVCLGLAPPLAEEMLCRGLVQRGLEPRLGPAAAVAFAALLFGALHRDPVHAAAVVPLGLYLGAAAWLAGSIRAAIACHLANNLVALLGVAFAWPRPEAPWTLPVAFALAALALGAVWRRAGSPPRLRGPGV
jgi:membrane protease YdiL (CAAX protease family)